MKKNAELLCFVCNEISASKKPAISSITYNHLNLPSVITVTGKGTITYTYDAAGNKLKKETVDNTVSPAKTTVTTYGAGAVYEASSPVGGGPVGADVLQFLAHEEGRIRFNAANNTLQYDYFLKDHLGNVRMVLTEEQKTDAPALLLLWKRPLQRPRSFITAIFHQQE